MENTRKYFNNLRHDFYEYFGRLPVSTGTESMAQQFLAKSPTNDLQVRDFYKDCDYIDDLAYWHIKQDKFIRSNKLLKILLFFKNKYLFDSVLEIGAGIGTESVIVANFFSKVVSVEPNSKNVDFFNWRIDKNNISNINVIFGDDSVLRNDKMDICFFMDVIEHVVDVDKFVKNVVSNANPEVFIFNMFSIHRKESFGDPYHFDVNKKKLYMLFENFGHKKICVRIPFPHIVFIKKSYDIDEVKFDRRI